MSESVTVLTVEIEAEPLGDGKEAFGVVIDAHEKVTPSWAAGMLRQIADDIERQGFERVGDDDE